MDFFIKRNAFFNLYKKFKKTLAILNVCGTIYIVRERNILMFFEKVDK